MPLPAVIRFIAPGTISSALPSLSRCITRPSNKIGDGGEPDVWVWSYIEALTTQKLHRPHLIEKR